MTWSEVMSNLLSNMWISFVGYLPTLLGVFIVLLIGWIAGRIIGKTFSKVLDQIGVDDALLKTMVGKAIEKSGITVVKFFDLTVRWFIYLIALLTASDILKIPALSNFMNQVVGYIPSLLAGVFIIIGGIIVTDAISDMMRSFVETATAEYASLIVGALRFFLYFMVVTIGLSMMQVDVSILYTFANSLSWGAALGIGVGLGVALGWGLKDVVAEKAKQLLNKKKR